MKKNFLADRFTREDLVPLEVIEDLANQYEDLINLSFGDSDITTNKNIIKAAFKDAKKGHTHYTKSLGDRELHQEISNYYKEEYDYSVDISEMIVVVGACHGMFLALSAVISPGDEVIIHEPYFTPYKSQVELVRGKAVVIPTYEEDNFEISIDALEKSITTKTKAIIINSPCNPTGHNFSIESILSIAALAKKYNLLILSDEVYSSFCFKEKFIPITTIEDMKERTITINSFSKNFAMTGWRVGYVLAPKYIIQCMNRINEGVCYTAPSISQRAALHALRLRKSAEAEIIKEFKKRMSYSYERLKNIPGISVREPEGTIYLFPSIKGTGLTSEEFCKRLANEAHVLVMPGNMFGHSGEGYIRIACTVEQKKLKVAFDRIEKFIYSNIKAPFI
ncbi:aspartate aminotransferase [Clostridium polyendosporum]|uniref:Aminotransferase n=1 Tax=Clostridium polyendosporum TaxID=69208 RepID=A0A919RWH0_9CLOT|nr:pyridoxal phosphate-dependent aminotransferase [Clostridium polyendosporum]GIM27594.1 aspartate aminotransferase [Clostridium polyendosporum]